VIESFENFGILVEYNSKFKDNVKIEELEECLLIISVFNPEKGKLFISIVYIPISDEVTRRRSLA
jgi:hypothetical protein